MSKQKKGGKAKPDSLVNLTAALSYVRGDTPIPSDVLLEMSKLFHCTTDYLLGIQRNDE